MLNTIDIHPQEIGSTAKDFLTENEFTDDGVCYECGHRLTVKSENQGFKENQKTEITIKCNRCGYEPTSN